MRVQNVLQLAGIYIVPAGDDHALDALGEVDEAVFIHLTEVAGVQPDAAVLMAAEGVVRFLGIINILEHDGRAGDADLAFEIRIKFLRGAGLDDLIIGIREGNADGALLLLVDGGQAAGGDALGGSVAFADFDSCAVGTKERIKALLQLH